MGLEELTIICLQVSAKLQEFETHYWYVIYCFVKKQTP